MLFWFKHNPFNRRYLRIVFSPASAFRYLRGSRANERKVYLRQRVEFRRLLAKLFRLGSIAFALIRLTLSIQVVWVLLVRLSQFFDCRVVIFLGQRNHAVQR